ncbi:MAG: glycosyltransferase family 4 protein, partial [Anaerolineales bacterium]|nr:glycosyltransferase family 4 protein [Anaerolineales bacterium]
EFSAKFPIPLLQLANLPIRKRLTLLIKEVNRFNPNIIISSGERPLWLGAVLKQLYQVPLLVIGHGTEFLQAHYWKRSLTQLALRQADQLIAVSEYTAKLMREYGDFKVHIIPNGADDNVFRPNLVTDELRGQLGLNGKRILLTVGNVSERKAQDVVIRALPEVVHSHPDVIYLVVGLPTRKKLLEDLAKDLGVSEHVRFTGVISQEMLPIYYNLCDLLVLVSRRVRKGSAEGYGIVVAEAALCGKTAIVSDHGGLPEAVHHGMTGLVVPEESPTETAAAILELLRNEHYRTQLESEALRHANQATWSQRIQAYDSILQEMVR